MEEYLGKETEIRIAFDNSYYLKDCGIWRWSEEMLEKVEGKEMNKREIEERIEKLQAELEEVKKILENYKEKENCKPEIREEYWYIDNFKSVYSYHWKNDATDNWYYDTGNCFKTKEEAEHRAELLETERQLMKYAREHNEKMDWEDRYQTKYYLCYCMKNNKIEIAYAYASRRPRTVHFSSEELIEQAIKEIGEEKIKAYCKELYYE